VPESNSSNDEHRLRERFFRWQQELRHQLTSHVTLIVSWSAGGLAFCGALLSSDYARFGGVTTIVFLVASCLFVVCLVLSLFISWNRLQDVRATLRILKARKENELDATIIALETQTAQLGHRTWSAINGQMWLFGAASVFFAFSVLLAFQDRLFPQCQRERDTLAKSTNAVPTPTSTPRTTPAPKPEQ
jgi:hypothetical protein